MSATIGGRRLGSCREERIPEKATDRRPRSQKTLEAPQALPPQLEQMKDEDISRPPQRMPGVEALGARHRARRPPRAMRRVVGTAEQARG